MEITEEGFLVPDEATIKDLALEHCWRVNARDVKGLLTLYAPDVTFEDPVGSGVRKGHEALRAHAAGAIAMGVQEIPGTPVAAQDGRHAAVPVTGVLPYIPGSPLLANLGISGSGARAGGTDKMLKVDYVMVIGVGASGLIEEMHSYWGTSDVTIVDRASVSWDKPRGR
jgi:steroid Delta-isomerase